jgi:hypothetical protein
MGIDAVVAPARRPERADSNGMRYSNSRYATITWIERIKSKRMMPRREFEAVSEWDR